MSSSLKVLVTGVNGLIGGRVYERLSESFIVVGSSRCNGEYVSSQFDLTNISQIELWLDKVQPNIIVNCAGVTAIAYAEDNQEETEIVNVQAVVKLTNWSKINHCKFIQFSTDFVFDGKKSSYIETDTPNPLSFYAKSKLRAEQIVLALNNSVVIRTSLVFGYAPNLARPNFPLWIVSELHKNHELAITADQFRSPTYVEDLAEAIAGIFKNSFSGIIHISGPERIGVFDFAITVANVFGLPTKLLVPTKTDTSLSQYQRPLSSALDITKARNRIYYEPQLLSNSLLQMKEKMKSKTV